MKGREPAGETSWQRHGDEKAHSLSGDEQKSRDFELRVEATEAICRQIASVSCMTRKVREQHQSTLGRWGTKRS